MEGNFHLSEPPRRERACRAQVGRLPLYREPSVGVRDFACAKLVTPGTPGQYRVLAVNRARLTEEDMDDVWAAFSKATKVEVRAKASTEVTLNVVSLE